MNRKFGFAVVVVTLLVATIIIFGIGVPAVDDLYKPSATAVGDKTYVAENNFLYSGIYCLDANAQLTLYYREYNGVGNSRIVAVAGKGEEISFVRQRLDTQQLDTVKLQDGTVVDQQTLTLGEVQVIGFAYPTFVTVRSDKQPGGALVYDSNTGACTVTVQPRDNNYIIAARYDGGEAVVAQLTDGSMVRWDRSGIYPAEGKTLTAPLPESITVPTETWVECSAFYLSLLVWVVAIIALFAMIYTVARKISKLSIRVGINTALTVGILIFIAGSAYLGVDQFYNLNGRLVQSREMTASLADILSTLEPTAVNDSKFATRPQYKTYYSTLSRQSADLVRSDLGVAVSSSIPRGQSVMGRYSEKMVELTQKALGGTKDSAMVKYNGEWAIAAASPLMSNGMPIGAVVLCESVNDVAATAVQRLLPVLIVSLCCALVVSISAGLRIRSVTVSLKHLTKQMNAMLMGQTVIPSLKRSQGELNAMTQVIQDICLDMTVKNYEMNNTVASYRRFVPNGLTTMLDRGSIMEVEAGDINLYRGNVAIMSVCNLQQARARLSDEGFMSFVNSCFALVEENIRKYNGFLLSSGFDLNALKLFYHDDALAAVGSGLSLLGDMETTDKWRDQKPQMAMIFHRVSFMYGMVGTQTQMFPFLSCGEMDFLQSYIGKLGELGVGAVATLEFYDHVSDLYASRYIGYIIDPDSKVEYKLYELLNTAAETVRDKLLGYDEQMQSAIELYYKNDFYMARSIFSTLLRECPQDGVARWYLFACERMFSGGALSEDKEQYQLLAVAQTT